MKKSALLLPLTAALLFSACDSTNNQATNNQTANQTDSPTNNPTPNQTNNRQTSENIDTHINEDLSIPKPQKNAAAIQTNDKTANNDNHKKDIVKFLYRDGALSLINNPNAEEIDTLFAYADRELQNAIALVKADSMNTYDGYADEISACSEVRYILNLSVGNGYSIDEAADVKYKVLDNGQVRASILLDADDDIEDSNFNNYKDFSLSCSGDGCKITDMYDSYGYSALQAVEEDCR